MADKSIITTVQGEGPQLMDSSSARPQTSYARQVLGLIVARRFHWGAILLASLLLNVCGLAAPRITQGVLDKVLPQHDLGLLTQLLILLLVVTALQIALTVWRRLTLVRLSLQIDREMLGRTCTHLLSVPLAFFKRHRPGDLLGRFHDHGCIRHLLAGALTRAAIDAVMVVIYLVVMFAYSARLSLLVLALALCFACGTLCLSQLLRRQHRLLMEESAVSENHLVEALVGVDMVKAMGLEGVMKQRWEQAYHTAQGSNYRTQRLRQLLDSGGAAVQCLSTAVLLGYGSVLVVQGALTAGQLVAFSLYAAQALGPLVGLITLWEEVQQARAALDRLQEVLDQEPEVQRPVEASLAAEPIRGHVKFENVSFAYGGAADVLVLRHVSFEICPGECVALAGQNGTGKSTVARLLLGLYIPTAGRITVDGVDLARKDLGAFRRQIGVVLQENLLVSGTIRENITLGDPTPDAARLAEAARLSNAEEFIAALPEGYETVVGEMGLSLSGGQRQRVNLARALYRNPRLLVLDEPTAALDQESRRRIEERLDAILASRSTLLITHDPCLIRRAHRVLILRDDVLGEPAKIDNLLGPREVLPAAWK